MIEAPTHPGCPFCDYLDGTAACAFVSRTNSISAFLNRTQYERGALLIVPDSHFETVVDIDSRLFAALFTEARRIARGMVAVYGAVGVNVFHNSGVRAGQSVAHVHVHVVPRYVDSEPLGNFRESAFDHTPVDELERIAAPLRAWLAA